MQQYKHVIVIGVDGAGAFFKNAVTPNLDKIFEGGAVAYDMRVTSFTSSCPSWATCLHGVLPEHHGLVENHAVEYFTYGKDDMKYPSFLRVVKEARPECEVAAIYAWIGINGIVEDDCGITKQKYYDLGLTDFVEKEYLDSTMPTVLFIHYGGPDGKGHMHGYGTPEHLAQISITDGLIKRIYDKLEAKGVLDDTLFIVTSDHGGTPDRRHGGLSDAEKYAMFAARGRTVERGGVPQNMEIRDVASVVLYALGIEQPECYTGRVPSGLFAGVGAKARPIYYDFEQPRCHVTEPTRDVRAFASENIKSAISHYLPFDDESVGEAEIHGDVRYTDGYFGTAIDLDDGYLTLPSFNPAGSFTISAWLKTQSPYVDAPFLATKRCEDFNEVAKDDLTDGFVVNFWRNTYVIPAMRTSDFNLVVGGRQFRLEAEFPSDYQYGWMHFALTVDRATGTVCLYHDFKKVATTLAWYLRKDFPIVKEGVGLAIGQDTTGEYRFKFNLNLDEFIVFDGALSEGELASLGEFYRGKK